METDSMASTNTSTRWPFLNLKSASCEPCPAASAASWQPAKATHNPAAAQAAVSQVLFMSHLLKGTNHAQHRIQRCCYGTKIFSVIREPQYGGRRRGSNC